MEETGEKRHNRDAVIVVSRSLHSKKGFFIGGVGERSRGHEAKKTERWLMRISVKGAGERRHKRGELEVGVRE